MAEKRGGKRNGSGRKKVKDPKVPITIYVRRSIAKNEKAREVVRQKALAAVELGS